MKTALTRHATPYTTGLFLVSTVSGVALFFHLGSNLFHSMHEWLSMLLLVPVGLHVWKNWGALLTYLRRHTLMLPLLLSLAAGIAFAVPGLGSTGSGGNPAFRLNNAATSAPLTQLAPLLHSSPAALQAKLQARGLQVASANDSVKTIAAANHIDTMAVLAGLME